MPGENTDKTTVAERVLTLMDLVKTGLTRKEILRYVAEKTQWGISERTVDNYLRKVRKKIEQAAEKRADYELGLGLLRLEDLYKRNISIQDYKAALAVQKERHDLLGLKPKDPVVQVNNTGDTTVYAHMDEDELDEEIARLQAEAGEDPEGEAEAGRGTSGETD